MSDGVLMDDTDSSQSWRSEITEALQWHGETWDDVESCTLNDAELDREFEYTREPFTLWSKRRVYFAACAEGLDWIESVPRHPCGESVKVGYGN
jgi:hypothetical protein